MTEPDDLSEIAKALEVLGLAEEEAFLFVHLLQTGPSKVGQLEPYFDVSRSKLYRLLDDLSRKGFVSKTPTRPTVYHPVLPDEAFDIGKERLDRRQEHLASVEERLLDPLQKLHRAEDRAEPTDWNKVEGAERIYEVVERVVAGAEDSIWTARTRSSSVSSLLPFVEEAWSAARRRIEQEAVDGRFLVGPDETTRRSLPGWVLEGRGCRTRVLEADRQLHFTLVDESELVFWVELAGCRSASGGEDVAVHTDARGVVDAYALLFEQLWTDARATSSKASDQA